MKYSAWIETFYIVVSSAIFNIAVVNCQSFQRSNSRGSFAHFVENSFTRLNATVLETLQVLSLGECTFACVNNHECFSVNFGNQAVQGKRTCELINTDRFTQEYKFDISQDFHHYNIKTPCMSNPCRSGGVCHPIYDKEDYQCACPFDNLVGKNCENLLCNEETLDICTKALISWKVTSTTPQSAVLSNCDPKQIRRGDEMLFIVTRGDVNDYGKYEIMKVDDVNGCNIALAGSFTQTVSNPSDAYIIAQLFPSYDQVTLSNTCILTCRQQNNGHGGILSLRAKTMNIDGTSKILTTGKGFHGGQGGDSRGGGGYGGESFLYLTTGNNGKGGDMYGASWAGSTGKNGIGGGGAGDGISSQGGPGGYNAGGGGGDSAHNADDGAGGGGGGGHFSGGGGGGGAGGCGPDGGHGGTASTIIGVYAGGGGVSACTGAAGGNGGQQGHPASGPCGWTRSGTAGTASRGGEGGDSCQQGWGGAGGGGGMQFGNIDFTKRLSYGGGGGGGGASGHGDDPNPGGRGGNGGGAVYLLLDVLTLDGTIESKGEAGQCLNTKSYRSAPGGSGAGGTVVIITKKLHGDPNGKIHVQGGVPIKCAYGNGGGGGGGIGRWVVQTEDTLLTFG